MTNSLERAPWIAERIGLYLAEFNELELQLTCVFACALSQPGEVAHAIFHQFRNLSDRIQVIHDVLPHLQTSALQRELTEALPLIASCNTFRNKLAHGVYEYRDRAVHLTGWVTSKGRTLDRTKLSAKLMDDEIRKIRRLNRNLMNLWKGTVVTLPHKMRVAPQGKPQPTHVTLSVAER